MLLGLAPGAAGTVKPATMFRFVPLLVIWLLVPSALKFMFIFVTERPRLF